MASRDKRDRFTFDIGGLRESLEKYRREPGQPMSSIIRMALIEWIASQESVSQPTEATVSTDDGELAITCLKKVVNGQMPTPQEITLLCSLLGVLEYRELEERLRCIASIGK